MRLVEPHGGQRPGGVCRAGNVDRMAAPDRLTGAARDAVRKEKLDRIVQVIRYTKTALRVLELPNVDLPAIDDSTVTVLAEEAAHQIEGN